MDNAFKRLFTAAPQREENGIYCFGNEDEGDCFEQRHFDAWQSEIFRQKWNAKGLLENESSRRLLDEIIDNHECVVDLACGPAMGFIPSIKQLSPTFPCMATDANFSVLREWRRYLGDNESCGGLDFAQFSAFDIPLKSDSVEAYSSFIGVSSTRNGESGYTAALSEIRRTLAADGRFYTVENEWTDIPAILGVFDKMNRQPWDCFREEQMPWHDRFIANGFEIVYEAPFEYRSLRADDNELGAAAVKLGIDIGMKYTAFIVRKKR